MVRVLHRDCPFLDLDPAVSAGSEKRKREAATTSYVTPLTTLPQLRALTTKVTLALVVSTAAALIRVALCPESSALDLLHELPISRLIGAFRCCESAGTTTGRNAVRGGCTRPRQGLHTLLLELSCATTTIRTTEVEQMRAARCNTTPNRPNCFLNAQRRLQGMLPHKVLD